MVPSDYCVILYGSDPTQMLTTTGIVACGDSTSKSDWMFDHDTLDNFGYGIFYEIPVHIDSYYPLLITFIHFSSFAEDSFFFFLKKICKYRFLLLECIDSYRKINATFFFLQC